MKIIIVFPILLVISTVCFSQQLNIDSAINVAFTKQFISESLSQPDYLKKSRQQKKIGWILAGSGGGVLLGTLLVQTLVVGVTYRFGNVPQGAVGYTIGGAALATGVGFLIAGSNTMKKANTATVFFKMQKTPLLVQQQTITKQSLPTLGIRLSL